MGPQLLDTFVRGKQSWSLPQTPEGCLPPHTPSTPTPTMIEDKQVTLSTGVFGRQKSVTGKVSVIVPKSAFDQLI